MKRSEHTCAVRGCDKTCPREYPFCSSCWYQVPPEQRKAVRDALRQGGADVGALHYAVATAAASAAGLSEVRSGAVAHWEAAYARAGSPELDEEGA